MNIFFKIIITKNYELQYSIVYPGNQEVLLQEKIIPSIRFNKNIIDFFVEDESAIHFMKNWFEIPDDYSTHEIMYQGKEYHLLPEVLFSLVINEIKKKIERQYIIEKTEIQLPVDNNTIKQRIKISLQALNFKGIEVEEINETINYNEQGDYLEEFLEKKEIIDNYRRMLSRAKEIKPENIEKLNSIDLNQPDIYREEVFNLSLGKIFSMKERTEMKMETLDNYCLFIASRFLNSLEDHFNLTLISKRMKLNLDKF